MVYVDKDKQREYQRQWVANRKAEFFKDKTCARCSSVNKLELDHIEPELKVSHRVWTWTKVKRLEELNKCQILCESCHMDKTLEQRAKTDHGRAQMYQAHKCRCDECRAWKRDSDKKYRG